MRATPFLTSLVPRPIRHFISSEVADGSGYETNSSRAADIRMADKDGPDLHKCVLGSLLSADFSCHDPESDVSLEFASVVIQRKWCKFGCRGSGGCLSCGYIKRGMEHLSRDWNTFHAIGTPFTRLQF